MLFKGSWWLGSSAAVFCLVLPMVTRAATWQRSWADVQGLRASDASVFTRDGVCHRGRLTLNLNGAVVIPHGFYGLWLTGPRQPEIPRRLVLRIEIRRRYRLTATELSDLWWYVPAGWKALFSPELNDLFPIAVAAHAGFTGWAVVYTPVAALASIRRPLSDTIEILPDTMR